MQRISTNKREAILNGTAPAWENDISCYPERIPQIFAEDFRRVRNIVTAHVKFERSDLSLTNFYDQYHKYLYMLYRDVQSWWGRLGDEFPDLNEITRFSVLVKYLAFAGTALPFTERAYDGQNRTDETGWIKILFESAAQLARFGGLRRAWPIGQ